MTTASIIILAKNEEENIGPCLEAVFSQKTGFDFEVIVVDSGSTDGTLDIVRSTPARLFEIPPGDFDHGGTRQYGAKQARGEYIVTLVADATPGSCETDRKVESVVVVCGELSSLDDWTGEDQE